MTTNHCLHEATWAPWWLTLKWCCLHLGWTVSMRQILPDCFRVWLHDDERAGQGKLGYGDNPQEALTAALWAAEEAKETPLPNSRPLQSLGG